MDVNLNLAAGNYVVGSWGIGAEYSGSPDGSPVMAPDTTFISTRYATGGSFGFPSFSDGFLSGYYGGNVRLSSAEVPTPSSFAALIGMGLMGLVAVRRGRSQIR